MITPSGTRDVGRELWTDASVKDHESYTEGDATERCSQREEDNGLASGDIVGDCHLILQKFSLYFLVLRILSVTAIKLEVRPGGLED